MTQVPPHHSPSSTASAATQSLSSVLAAPEVCANSLPLQDFLTFRLVALANELQSQVTRHYIAPATAVGLVEWRLMGLLHQHGELHAGALARLSLIDKAQISRCLQPLIDQAWVLRRADPEHGRRHLLSLSAAGQAAFDQVLAQARPLQAALWNALSCEERTALLQIMAKLSGAARHVDQQAQAGASESCGPAPKSRRLGLGKKLRSRPSP